MTRSGRGPGAAPTSSDLAGIDDVLAEIDARAKELERRTAAVLAQNNPEPDQRNP